MDFSEYNQDQLTNIKDAIAAKKTIFLTANWGVGKTYFIKSVISNFFKEKKTRYVSLFGIETFDRLTQNILSSHENKDEFFFNGGANLLVEQLSDEIIILDDLERTHIDLALILGLIDRLKVKNTVIFICNKNKIKDDNFLNQIEKISDQILDNLIVDFEKIAIKLYPENILEDVLYAFYILKDNNIRTAIKVSQHFKLLGDKIKFLSFKEIRLFTFLAIEKTKFGYVSDCFNLISQAPWKKIQGFLYDTKEIKINNKLEQKYHIKSTNIEVQNEVCLTEFQAFVEFIKQIRTEDQYHIKKSLLNLLKFEYLDDAQFTKEYLNSHPAFELLPSGLVHIDDFINQSNEKAVTQTFNDLNTIILNFESFKTKDALTDFKAFYFLKNAQYSFNALLDNIQLDDSILLINKLISLISDTDIDKQIELPTESNGPFSDLSLKIIARVQKEREHRKYNKIKDIIKNNDLLSFYKNKTEEIFFTVLSGELLEIIGTNYLNGSRLASNLIDLCINDNYFGETRIKRDKAVQYLRIFFEETDALITDRIIKRRIKLLINNKQFNNLFVEKDYSKFHTPQAISNEEYEQAIKIIKNTHKTSNENRAARKIVFDYKSQLIIESNYTKPKEKYDVVITEDSQIYTGSIGYKK